MIVEAREDTVRLYGDIRENQWLNIKAAANLLLREHRDGIIIDCSRVQTVTSEGAQTFRDAVEYIEKHNARIILVDLPAGLEQQLRDIPGLRSRLPIAATVDEARRSLRVGRSEDTVESASSGPAILVPILEEESGARAAAMAGRLGREDKAVLHLAYLLAIPRNLPLNTPMAEDEERAEGVLHLAETAARKYGLRTVRHVQRTRDAAEAILQLAETLKARSIVISRPAGGTEEDTVDAVLKRAECEVIVDQAPPKA